MHEIVPCGDVESLSSTSSRVIHSIYKAHIVFVFISDSWIKFPKVSILCLNAFTERSNYIYNDNAKVPHFLVYIKFSSFVFEAQCCEPQEGADSQMSQGLTG